MVRFLSGGHPTEMGTNCSFNAFLFNLVYLLCSMNLNDDTVYSHWMGHKKGEERGG